MGPTAPPRTPTFKDAHLAHFFIAHANVDKVVGPIGRPQVRPCCSVRTVGAKVPRSRPRRAQPHDHGVTLTLTLWHGQRREACRVKTRALPQFPPSTSTPQLEQAGLMVSSDCAAPTPTVGHFGKCFESCAGCPVRSTERGASAVARGLRDAFPTTKHASALLPPLCVGIRIQSPHPGAWCPASSWQHLCVCC